MPDGGQIFSEYAFIREHYSSFLTRWNLQAPYLAPSRAGILNDRAPGQDQMADVYDSTTLGAADMLAKFISSSTFSPGQRWGRIIPRKFGLQDRDDVDDWCDECTTRMLKSFGGSNFYAEGPESILDMVAFGTTSLYFDEKPNYSSEYNERRGGFRGLRFSADKTGRFFNGENAENIIDKEYRELKLTARAAIDKWGAERMPERLKTLDRSKQETIFTFIHAVYPRPKKERRGSGYLSYPWASCFIEKDSKQIVAEGGFKRYPFLNARWEKTPGEIPGRGPGDRAFPDTRTLNLSKQLGLEDHALKVRPPFLQANEATVGPIRMQPAGRIVVKTKGNQSVRDVFSPFETGSRPEIVNIKEEQLRHSINQIFFIDILRDLLKVEKSEMTAYEFAQKLELMYRILGPVYGRFESEFMAPLWDGVFSLMYDAGALPPPPPALFDGTRDIQIEFVNPLALAQNSQQNDAILKTYSAIPILALNDPARIADLRDRLDDDQALKIIAKTSGLPEVIIRSDEATAKLHQVRVDQRQKQAQIDEALAASEGAKNAAPLIKALQQPAAGSA